jgi:hypothetical protein
MVRSMFREVEIERTIPDKATEYVARTVASEMDVIE